MVFPISQDFLKHDRNLYDNVAAYAESMGIPMFDTKIIKNSQVRVLSADEEISVVKYINTFYEYDKCIYSLAKEIIKQDEE